VTASARKSPRATGRRRRGAAGGSAAARQRRSAGNPGYDGYEYQIDVTVWVALDLVIAKEAADAVIIEPPSNEDIEAAVIDPDKASLGLTADSDRFDLTVQIKSRSTEPWTAASVADILTGGEPDGAVPRLRVRTRPLAMLAADPRRRYVFVTNESLAGSLRAHHGEHLLDFPEVDVLPPHARTGYDAASQVSIAPRITLCSDFTAERLQHRVERLLNEHGHVPSANQRDCVAELREAVRSRMRGHAGGRWTRADLLAVLAHHGGSVLPTRAMDQYVRPRSYDAIRRSLEARHAVVIAGPSGTGKTLTADILEHELRTSNPPFFVIGEEHGPGYIRGQLTRTDALLFHLRDPWGGNRLTPDADRWSNELPKLLRDAGAGRKFIVTSRSDVLQSAGHTLERELKPYTVAIEIEDYGRDRLGRIYDRIGSDLRGHAAARAKAYRTKALDRLTRPYEIDRFLVALSCDDEAKPRKIDDIVAESQIEAISSVIADQIAAWGADGVTSAAIVWAMLSARGAIAREMLPALLRRMRLADPTLRPDVDGLIDFLVAGRNLRRDGAALAFYHPRVEDGLRMAMLRRQPEAEHVLSRLADALAAGDGPGVDWGVETVLGILRAVSKVKGMELMLACDTQARLDAFLETAATVTNDRHDFERALGDLARYGSPYHAPSRLARILVNGRLGKDEIFGVRRWRAPIIDANEFAALQSDPRTPHIVERFVREVLPFSDTHY
jgi:hypothetical protein